MNNLVYITTTSQLLSLLTLNNNRETMVTNIKGNQISRSWMASFNWRASGIIQTEPKWRACGHQYKQFTLLLWLKQNPTFQICFVWAVLSTTEYLWLLALSLTAHPERSIGDNWRWWHHITYYYKHVATNNLTQQRNKLSTDSDIEFQARSLLNKDKCFVKRPQWRKNDFKGEINRLSSLLQQ